MSKRVFRQAARADAGSAIVELSVVLPMLVIVMVGTIDMARVFYTAMELTNAARAGAQFGAANPANSSNIPQMGTIATSAVNISFNTPVASSPVCECAADDGSSFAATSCTSTTCPGGQHRVITVSVTTSTTFNLIMPSVLPFGSIPLSRTATLRVSE